MTMRLRAPHDLRDQESGQENPKQIVDKLARFIVDRGWGIPLSICLEIFRPLSFVGSQMMLLAEPLFHIPGTDSPIRRYACLLEDRRNVALLIERIDHYNQGSKDRSSRQENCQTLAEE